MSRAKGTSAKAKAVVHPTLDEDWELMVASFEAAKKPSKWKFQLLMETGEISVVRHVAGRFVKNYRGQEVQLLPLSRCAELERADAFTSFKGPRPSETQGTMEEFEDRLEERLTGNHQPRNHPVRIPTAAGQPVRG